MIFNLQNKLQRALFDQQVRDILLTPPASLHDHSPVHLLSQLQHKDVRMYLVAAKSFLAHVKIRRVTVLNDGSLTADDQALLRSHVPGLEVRPITEFQSPHCPRGGCWERLQAVMTFSKDSYVIQLDSDTVTAGEVSEVSAAAATDTSFCIGTWDNQRLELMLERAHDAKRFNSAAATHVQVMAEQAFDRVPGASALRYARGCAGFSGFAKGSVNQEFIEGFSAQMNTLVGSKWSTWGSEQVMSNVVVANAERATVLPHPKYADCGHIAPETTFVHFIGSCRFGAGAYARLSRAAISKLQITNV